MAKRTTRKLIIDRCDHMIRELDNCLMYLYELNQMAKGGSAWITSQSPFLGTGIDELKKAVKLFRQGL